MEQDRTVPRVVAALGFLLVLVGAVGACAYWHGGQMSEADKQAASQCALSNAAEEYSKYLNGDDSPSECDKYEKAPRKGSVYAAWAGVVGLGLLIGVAGLLAPSRGRSTRSEPSQEGLAAPALQAQSDTRTCPYCAEEVKMAAVKCKHCQSALD